MKFGEILKSVGLIRKDDAGGLFNTTKDTRIAYIPEAEVDRLHQGYQSYHLTPHVYHHPFEMGSYYYPPGHNIYGQRGYGLRLSGGGHHNGAGVETGGAAVGAAVAGGGYGHASGYVHTGYGGYTGGGTSGSSGYDYSQSAGRHKYKGSSVMTALTLLSFFFFINLLQNCLRDHMDAMNPTVMVMTAGAARNRLNKFTEINSREILDNINSERSQFVYENKDSILYPNSTAIRAEDQSEPKVKNDYFRQGDTLYMRLN